MSEPLRPQELAARVEEDRIPRRAVVVTSVIALAIIVVAVFVADGLLRSEAPARDAAAPVRATAQIGIVEQTLLAESRRGLDERARQRASLATFGWADRARGLAKIPIERAMDLVTDPAFVRQALAAQAQMGDGGAGDTGRAGEGM
jgi:hypothetical protein